MGERGIWLAEIIFRSKMDAKRFYDHLLKCFRGNPSNQDILLLEDRYIVKVLDRKVNLEMLKHAFYEFIVKIKRDDWFRAILQDQYFSRIQKNSSISWRLFILFLKASGKTCLY